MAFDYTLILKRIEEESISCDVEGYELEVLKGGKQTLREVSPIIFCETHFNCSCFGKDEFLDFFRQFSYKVYVVWHSNDCFLAQTGSDFPGNYQWIIAVPKDKIECHHLTLFTHG